LEHEAGRFQTDRDHHRSGAVANWRVGFYDTKTGTTLLSSASVTRHGNTVTIHLPDFKNDIAFKLYAQ